MKKLSLVLLFIFVAGCSLLNQPKAETTKQALLTADRNFTAVVSSANAALENGQLSDTQAKTITPYINSGNDLLDAAWAAYRNGKKQKAVKKIRNLETIVRNINAVIERHGSDKNVSG